MRPVAPSSAEEQRPLQSRIGEVEDGEQVDVVTAGDPSAKVGPYGKAVANVSPGDEVGSDVGECLERRLEVLEVRHQIVARVVDQTGGGVAERPELLQRASSDGAAP